MVLDPGRLTSLIADVSEVKPLAVGGQKIVFRATHCQHGDVVIKFLLDKEGYDRFAREIEIAQTAGIASMPHLYEHGKTVVDGSPVYYIVEEFISGVSLRQRLQDDGPLSTSETLDLLECLLRSTVEMEKQHMVHRDIKPENIMITDRGGFRLLDFGIARCLDKPSLTHTDARFGPHTPGYSAPEQFRNLKDEIDVRADLFSIGVVAYEALSGRNPFRKGSDHPLEILHRTETVTPREFIIPGDTQRQLIGFLSVLMQRFPSRRPRDAQTALDWFRSLRPTVTV